MRVFRKLTNIVTVNSLSVVFICLESRLVDFWAQQQHNICYEVFDDATWWRVQTSDVAVFDSARCSDTRFCMYEAWFRLQLLDKISGVILLGDKDKLVSRSLFEWLYERRVYLDIITRMRKSWPNIRGIWRTIKYTHMKSCGHNLQVTEYEC